MVAGVVVAADAAWLLPAACRARRRRLPALHHPLRLPRLRVAHAVTAAAACAGGIRGNCGFALSCFLRPQPPLISTHFRPSPLTGPVNAAQDILPLPPPSLRRTFARRSHRAPCPCAAAPGAGQR